MAMNKKEQAAFAAMERDLLVARAFCRTQPIAPDVPAPRGGYTNGYRASFSRNTRIEAEAMWSSAIGHGKGYHDGKAYRSGSQNPISLYSTPVLALRALRHATENEMAQQLAKIDAAIAVATQGEQHDK